MECPHCKKEVFGKGHNVSDLYEEPEPPTKDEIIKQLQAENADLKKEIVKLKTQMLPNEYESLTTEAIDEKQALTGQKGE